jgi:hypothetical protein
VRLRKMDVLAALIVILTLAGPAAAAPITVYNEAVLGDLSGSFNNSPTSVPFLLGQNEIIGQTGTASVGTVQDYFTFTVPVNASLRSVTLVNSSLATGPPPSLLQFIGLERGSVFTRNFTEYANGSPTQGAATAELLGWAHFSPANNGTDILPLIGSGAGAIGFNGPLGAGQYTAWIQDTSVGISTYDLVFDVQPVPEPSSVLLTLTGLALLTRVRRRRR